MKNFKEFESHINWPEYSFADEALIDSDIEEENDEVIECYLCGKEKTDVFDEWFDDICPDCIEEYYTPERAMQFLADCKFEKIFYVERYMDGECSEANDKLIALCKAEFERNIQFAQSQYKQGLLSQEYLNTKIFEYQILKDFILTDADAWNGFGEWCVEQEKRTNHKHENEQQKAQNVIHVKFPANVNLQGR